MAQRIFISGPISPGFIADAISKHQSKTTIGAHDLFLGQVRADLHGGKTVQSIEYTAYEKMARQKIDEIREEAITKYSLACLHIYHSLGVVKKGEICFFVFVSAPHRKAAFEAVEFVVEKIKTEVPIFGKEIFEDHSHTWKINT